MKQFFILILQSLLAVLVLLHDGLVWTFERPLRWFWSLRPIQMLTEAVARLPPAGVLAVLLVPVLVTEPFKIAGLWWLATGHIRASVIALVLGHSISLLLVERIFVAGLPALRTYRWFDLGYTRFTKFRDALLAWLGALPLVMAVARIGVRIRELVRESRKRLVRAIQRLRTAMNI